MLQLHGVSIVYRHAVQTLKKEGKFVRCVLVGVRLYSRVHNGQKQAIPPKTEVNPKV